MSVLLSYQLVFRFTLFSAYWLTGWLVKRGLMVVKNLTKNRLMRVKALKKGFNSLILGVLSVLSLLLKLLTLVV
jgi:hypothetical protein